MYIQTFPLKGGGVTYDTIKIVISSCFINVIISREITFIITLDVKPESCFPFVPVISPGFSRVLVI